MSAKYQTLLSINYVTDHDCGNYQIGEIDFGINGSIRQYIEDFGLKGKEQIISKLAYLIYEVEKEFRYVSDFDNSGLG